MTTPVLECRKVNKVYGGEVPTHVLHDIDLTVLPGEFVAVVGASGSGKTTLLNLLGLLDHATSGAVLVQGRDVSGLRPDEMSCLRRDLLGFVFQAHHLLPEFTVLENALMPANLRGAAAARASRPRVVAMLERVGLGHRLHFHPGQLSGGQQQRAAIIRALSNDPAVVLADEPTGNLDTASGREVFQLMRELNRETGKAFVMVTHDPRLQAEVDRVVTLVDGRVAPGLAAV